ncbi:hypothetical protein PSUB009319_02380 [Ralstonia sp. SET104]|nr:hypothetical protein PSUB009319_02380 [Ralstonia sp. SET104]
MNICGDDSLVRSETISELIGTDSFDDEALRALLDAQESGKYTPNETLVLVVAKTCSSELYLHVKDQLKEDVWSLIGLLTADYPDPDVERIILEKLFNEASEIGNHRRVAMVEALAEHGSVESLATLREILHEQVPLAQTKKFISAAINGARTEENISTLLMHVEAAAQRDFAEKLVHAIGLISERGKSAMPVQSARPVQEQIGPGDLVSIDEDVVKRITEFKSRAHYYRDKDSRASLQYARQAVECAWKAMCRSRGQSPEKTSLERATGGQLLAVLQTCGALPRDLELATKTINTFCNFTMHDQGEHENDLTPRLTKSVLLLVDEFVEWFMQTQLGAAEKSE